MSDTTRLEGWRDRARRRAADLFAQIDREPDPDLKDALERVGRGYALAADHLTRAIDRREKEDGC